MDYSIAKDQQMLRRCVISGLHAYRTYTI